MDNDKKNSLRGKLRNAFNVAVLAGAGLIAGLSPLAAQAQTYQPQVVQVQQVQYQQQYEQQKPWAGDPVYREAVHNFQVQSALRIQTYREQEQMREDALNNRNGANFERQITQGQRNAKGGWSGTEVLSTIRNAGTAARTYNSQLKVLRMQLAQRELTERQLLQRQISTLDARYAKMPEYKVVQAAPVSQRAVTQQQQSSSDEIYKSPEEMRAQLIKDYQTAVLAAAKAGKPAPSPERFHLDKDDPAIKIPTGPGQR